VAPAIEVIAGAYLALRGGGAWAMDIYVQKMQDRVRAKALANQPGSAVNSPES
jgi:hypothetical protein